MHVFNHLCTFFHLSISGDEPSIIHIDATAMCIRSYLASSAELSKYVVGRTAFSMRRGPRFSYSRL